MNRRRMIERAQADVVDDMVRAVMAKQARQRIEVTPQGIKFAPARESGAPAPASAPRQSAGGWSLTEKLPLNLAAFFGLRHVSHKYNAKPQENRLARWLAGIGDRLSGIAEVPDISRDGFMGQVADVAGKTGWPTAVFPSGGGRSLSYKLSRPTTPSQLLADLTSEKFGMGARPGLRHVRNMLPVMPAGARVAAIGLDNKSPYVAAHEMQHTRQKILLSGDRNRRDAFGYGGRLLASAMAASGRDDYGAPYWLPFLAEAPKLLREAGASWRGGRQFARQLGAVRLPRLRRAAGWAGLLASLGTYASNATINAILNGGAVSGARLTGTQLF